MIRLFFKTAFRNIIKHRLTTVINIIGLSLGIACCLIIFLIVKHEQSFDQFHTDAERIFRIVRVTKNVNQSNELEYRTGISFPLPEILEKEMPHLENITVLYHRGEALIKSFPESEEERLFKQDGVTFLRQNFFEVLDYHHPDFKWIHGNPQTALSSPNSVVITKSVAEKAYATTDVIGKPLKLNNRIDCLITGVVSDFPENSDFPFSIMIPYALLQNGDNDWLEGWYAMSGNFQAIVKLHEGVVVAEAEQYMNEIHSHYVSEKLAAERKYKLQPLNEVHHDTRFGNFNHTISKNTLLGLSLIGILLMITSGINFSNLATAQSLIRAKEIGIRKVMGSSRISLIFQFLGETYILTLIAATIGLGLAELSVLYFNDLLNIGNDVIVSFNLELVIFLFVLSCFIGLVAGIYPALVLSGFQPVQAIKSKISSGNGGKIRFSKVLVLLQFCITQLMIIGTIVIFSQLKYLQNAELGFQQEAIIKIGIPIPDGEPRSAFAGKIANLAEIEMISFSSHFPMSERNNWIDANIPNSTSESTVTLDKNIDENYFETFGLKLVAGRGFKTTDSARYVIPNEELLKKLGINPEEAIGRTINISQNQKTIIGVAADFHTFALHETLDPVAFTQRADDYNLASIKLNKDWLKASTEHEGLSTTLKKIKTAWQESYPDYVFEYDFYDETIKSYYQEEERMSSLFNIFSIITVFISCIGLYGLTMFITLKRTKEVGIRKILGASISQLVMMLSKSFARLVFIAFLVAAPIGWVLSNKWLENFAYSIEPGILLFLLSAIIAFLIALSTIAYQAIKTALTNPVNALRSE